MLGAILGAVTGLGSIFGGAGKGAAEERGNQNNYQAQAYDAQQRALLSLLGLDERATMDRAQLGIAAPQARTKQAVIGSLLSRLQPASVQPPAGVNMGRLSGGIGSAIGGPGMQAAGQALQMQALKALLSGSDVPAATNYAKTGMLPMPAYKKAGKGESFMSALGLMGAGAQAAAPYLPKSQPKPNTPGFEYF